MKTLFFFLALGGGKREMTAKVPSIFNTTCWEIMHAEPSQEDRHIWLEEVTIVTLLANCPERNARALISFIENLIFFSLYQKKQS